MAQPAVPAGVVNVGGDWYYEENARGGGVSALGMEASSGAPANATPEPASEERNKILDLFRN